MSTYPEYYLIPNQIHDSAGDVHDEDRDHVYRRRQDLIALKSLMEDELSSIDKLADKSKYMVILFTESAA